MAPLWRAAATTAARWRPGLPSAASTIHGCRSSSSSSSSSTTTLKTLGGMLFRDGVRLGFWVGAVVYVAKKANKKHIDSIREELQKRADNNDISSIREELQTSNALLSRCIIV